MANIGSEANIGNNAEIGDEAKIGAKAYGEQEDPVPPTPQGVVLYDGAITIEGGEGEIELLAEMVEGRTVTGTFGEYNVSGTVVDNGGGALGANLVFEGYTESDYIEVDADGLVEINASISFDDGDYQFKITMSGK